MLYGKLKEGVSLQSASMDMNTISGQLATEYPDAYPANQGLTNTLTPMRIDMAGESKSTFYLLMAITLLVLLIACANVANLNLARTASRKQEFAIREALGATPSRIARQVLTESIILSLIGGLLGLGIAMMSIDLLSDFAALYTPLASEVKINANILMFCLLVSVLTGVISGATAAFQNRRINEELKEGSGNITASGNSMRLRQALLITQFCLAFVVLTSASLVSLSLYRLHNQNIGFETSNLVTIDLSSSPTNRSQFVQNVADRLTTRPDIHHVAFASEVPLLKGRDKRRFFQIEGRPPVNRDERPEAIKNEVSANFHQVLHIPLLQGRYLNQFDDQNSPGSVLVNQSFVDTFFNGESAIDQRLSLDEGQSWLTIRGVVGDVREVCVNIDPTPTLYTAWISRWHYDLQLFVDSPSSLPIIRDAVADAVRAENPKQAVANVETFEVIKANSMASSQLVGILVSLFALLAFSITLSGVIGVVAFNVSQRRKEIGIRMALGAAPNRIQSLFATQGLILCSIGLVLGAIVMMFFSTSLETMLFETEPVNLTIYITTALLVLASASLAMWGPIKQAMKIQPNQALREL